MSEIRRVVRPQNISGDTPQQIEAFRAPLTPTMVIAGAGSGKTLVLAKRFEYLVREKNIDPTRILAITFSRRATTNMRRRIFKLLEDGQIDKEVQSRCRKCTFHKISIDLLTEEISVNWKERQKICHDKKNRLIVKDLINLLELPISSSGDALEIITGLRWICKKDERDEFTVEELIDVAEEVVTGDPGRILEKFPHEMMLKLYRAHDQKFKEMGMYSFDDILLTAHQFLRDPKVAEKWSSRFDAILCDEFQDIDDVQFEIIKKLCSKNASILCVGDPDQSIYGFRGAVSDIFTKFKDYFETQGKEVTIRKLELNFRSTPEILEVSNKLIEPNHKTDELSKTLRAYNPSIGLPVKLHLTNSNESEENQIINKILELNEKYKVPFKEMAVLARNRKHREEIEFKLLRKRIPYENRETINQDLRREEVKDLICWLNIAVGGSVKVQGSAMKRVINKPRRGLGDKKIAELFSAGPEIAYQQIMKHSTDPKIIDFRRTCLTIKAIANKPDSEVDIQKKIHAILKEVKIFEYYEENASKYNRIKSFLESTMSNAKNIEQVKEGIINFNPRSLDGDNLMISTIHGVKGLEFDYVFLMKLNEGKLPSNICIKKQERNRKNIDYIAEERRLTYVAMTRAKKGLFLSTSAKDDGKSRFLADVEHLIPNPLIDNLEDIDERDDLMDELEDGEGINLNEEEIVVDFDEDDEENEGQWSEEEAELISEDEIIDED
ncbi:ATP-dependent helicase [Candidatus Mycoplasma haematohominis]|uniref:ATP-dependent helicase n=1 Tax=Candidatus Mycoplasma haematohominis TaxID=1494318 RepID=UPI001C0A7066|nr:ATP-dependent helicase [Candidatus Mycoplasma haemohominis]